MLFLRQATSQTVMVGPYVGSDGGAITGLTLTQSAFMLSLNGGAFVAKNETTAGSHRILGYYSAMFNDTDTASPGRLLLVSCGAAAQPVWAELTVLTQPQYDYFASGNMANIFGADMSSITPIAARSPVNAMRALRNRVTSSGSILTVYGENDSTAVWTSALTVNASASLIVESDPA